MWTTCFHRLFFTPEPSNVIILFFSSLHFCSLVVTASRRICHDPALGSNAFFHVYAAEMQRLVPVWTVPMASGADLHIACLSLPAERERWCPDSYCLQLGIPTEAVSTSQKCFFCLFYIGVISGIRRARIFCRFEVCPNWRSSKVWIDMKLSWLNHQYKNQ